MARDRFAAGRPVREEHQAIDARAVAAGPVLNRPQAVPQAAGSTLSQAHVLPPRMGRPTLATRSHDHDAQQNASNGNAQPAPTEQHGTQAGFYRANRQPQTTGQAQTLHQGTATVPLGNSTATSPASAPDTMQAGPRRQPVDNGLRPNGAMERPGQPDANERSGGAALARPAQPTEITRPQAPRMKEGPREIRPTAVQPQRILRAPQMPSRPAPAPQATKPAAPASQPQTNKH